MLPTTFYGNQKQPLIFPDAEFASLEFQRNQGVYVYDTAGKKYLDWTSEAVCVNLGHTVPESATWLPGLCGFIDTQDFF